MRAEFPKRFKFLFDDHRYKGIYGGRGKGASWAVARYLLIESAQKQQLVLCARETQKSLEESVHRLLSDQINMLGLGHLYTIQQASIKGKNGSEFIFAGLRQNASALKSYEGVDRVWIEEAATVSEDSWMKLIPTIRKPGSQIILTWNPELETDPTHKRFILDPPPSAKIVKGSYRDLAELGWFPEELEAERMHMLVGNPDMYRHVWEGECRSTVVGAVFGLEMKRTTDDGRICSVPYDRTKPVDTVWDLGYGDKTAIWFVQAYGGWFNFIDYIEDNGETVHHYLIELQRRGYRYDKAYLPHDALDTIIHGKLAAERERSIQGIIESEGLKTRMVPKTLVAEQINAARTIFPQCRFDEQKCADGIRALRMYQFGPPTKDKNGAEKLTRDPLHDHASHGASAFQYACWAVKQGKVEVAPAKRKFHGATAWS